MEGNSIVITQAMYWLVRVVRGDKKYSVFLSQTDLQIIIYHLSL
jgi:hypothetical protein